MSWQDFFTIVVEAVPHDPRQQRPPVLRKKVVCPSRKLGVLSRSCWQRSASDEPIEP